MMFSIDKICSMLILLAIAWFALTSCSISLTSALIKPALEDMQQQSDIELVCEGTPAYLLMIDSLIAGNPEEIDLLTLGAKGYSGYIGAMTECAIPQSRVNAIANKGFKYGMTLLSQRFSISPADSMVDFESKLNKAAKKDSSTLFWASFSWITWVQQQNGAPAAMADLGKIEKLLLKIIELDERVQDGAAHFLLGGYYGARPAMLGGNPEKSTYHFEKALQISKRKMLIYQTIYAETYARNTMNQELHDSLLQEVIGFELESIPENTLTNQIAKKRATRLLEEQFFN